MRWLPVLLLLAACVDEPAPETGAAATDEGAEREQPEPEPATEPEPAEPMGRCHVSCCSPEVLELQQRTAAESGDPSIANECCFCDD